MAQLTTTGSWEQAQVGVIGSLLIDPDHVAGLIFQRARREHFGDPALRHVFDAAQSLWSERTPIDPITLLHAAGSEYEQLLVECVHVTPTAANIEVYLSIIKSEARLHELQAIAGELLGVTSERDALEIYERMGMVLRETDDVEDLSWEQLVGDYLDRMNDPAPANYLSWGIPQLDQELFVSLGDFCVLAADSSVGKTALALQFAYHMARHGKRVLFFSLETPKEKLEDRLIAEKQVASVAMPRSKLKALSETDYKRVTDIGMTAGKVPLRIIRRADTLAQIQNRTIMHNADVIFIDYLQIIDHRAKSRFETVTEISMALHRMANKLGVTIVALSQVTPPESGEITIQDLRESGQIKNDAEVILLMMKDKTFPGARKLVIGKDKDGASNKRLLLSFDPQHMTFTAYRRKDPSEIPGQGAPLYELADDEGGEAPF